MGINWKVRFKNVNFWLEFIPMLFLLVQYVMDLVGYPLPDLLPIQEKVLHVVNIVFGILAALGIVTDHTTAGTGDSLRALSYETPYKDL